MNKKTFILGVIIIIGIIFMFSIGTEKNNNNEIKEPEITIDQVDDYSNEVIEIEESVSSN